MRKIIYIFLLIFIGTLITLQANQSRGLSKYVGSSYKYKIITEEGETVYFTYSILKKTPEGIWLEYVVEEEGRAPNVAKLLVYSNSKIGERKVKRFIVKSGKEPAQELPAFLAERMEGEFDMLRYYKRQALAFEGTIDNKKEKFIKKKNVKVKTKAGKFKCDYIKQIIKKKNEVYEYYLSPELPAGIVKIVKNGETIVELIKYKKKGAKSLIKGKVKQMSFPYGER